MNEIERLIKELPRPNPSIELNHRIQQIINSTPRQSIPELPFRRWVGRIVSTAVAVLIGFMLGRQSVTPTTASPRNYAPAKVRIVDVGTPARIGAVTAVDLQIVELDAHQDEVLTRLVMPPNRPQGLFGSETLDN